MWIAFTTIFEFNFFFLPFFSLGQGKKHIFFSLGYRNVPEEISKTFQQL